MRFLLAALLSTAALAAEDAREIVLRSVNHDTQNFQRARSYTFLQHSEQRELDAAGRVKSVESKTYDITILYDRPYARLIERDGKPLSPKEEAREQAKLSKLVAERQRESQQQRTRRLADYEKSSQRQRAFLKEIPEAYEFRLAGEENIEGRNVYVIEARPRAGYRPRDLRAGILTKFRGRFWIDKAEYQWVRVEAEVIDTVSFGLFLARLGKGCRVEFQQARVNDGVWLPRRISVSIDARLALVKKLRREQDITYRNYRKFQADSRVVSTTEIP